MTFNMRTWRFVANKSSRSIQIPENSPYFVLNYKPLLSYSYIGSNEVIADMANVPSFAFNLDGILIRKCRFEDLGGVIYVNRKTLPENYSKYLFLSMFRVFRDIFYVAIDRRTGYVVGYCMNKTEENSLSFFSQRSVLKGHVFSLGVLHEYRRRGIASALLALSMDKMFRLGCEEIFLEVRVSNEPAQRLYRKFNYRVVARIPRYYADGEDAYVMATQREDSLSIVRHVVSRVSALGVVEETE